MLWHFLVNLLAINPCDQTCMLRVGFGMYSKLYSKDKEKLHEKQVHKTSVNTVILLLTLSWSPDKILTVYHKPQALMAPFKAVLTLSGLGVVNKRGGCIKESQVNIIRISEADISWWHQADTMMWFHSDVILIIWWHHADIILTSVSWLGALGCLWSPHDIIKC